MIKLFRKIRYDLIGKNLSTNQGTTRQAAKNSSPGEASAKAGKYFKYAIGEIVLVMIGILLALQVSNWNQDRKDRINERKLLDNIHRDFVKNKENFDSMKVKHHRSLTYLDSMIALYPLNRDSLKIALYSEYNTHIEDVTYNAYSSTVESVIYSNSLQLIQDEELQEYLVSWKDVLIDFIEEEHYYYKMMNDEYWPYHKAIFDYTQNEREMNLAGFSDIKYQNLNIIRRVYLRSIIKAIKEEPIEKHIDDIIRLTLPNG
jgi:hypothetical protein